MKQYLVILLTLIFSYSTAQDRLLGYENESDHYLRNQQMTAIYSLDSKEIIANYTNIVTKKDILIDRYLVLEKPFDKNKDLTFVDLKTGYHSDFEYYAIIEEAGQLYATSSKEHSQFSFDPGSQVLTKTEENVKRSTKMHGWRIYLSGTPEYKDIIIDKENKVIKSKSSRVSSFDGCGPYLFYFSGTNTLIDSSGNITKMDHEILRSNPLCYNVLSRNIGLRHIKNEVFQGEEYDKKISFVHNDNIYFGNNEAPWKYKDPKGKYHQLNFTHMSQKSGRIFGVINGSAHLLDNDLNPIINTGTKYPRIQSKRYLYIKGNNTFYDLDADKYIIPENCDDAHISKFAVGYKQNDKWTIRRFEDDKTFTLNAEKIVSTSERGVIVKDSGSKIFYDWDDTELFSGDYDRTRKVTNNFVQICCNENRPKLMFYNGEEIDFPNLDYATNINESFALIKYRKISVLDKNKTKLYEIRRFISQNKLGITSVENGVEVFKNFDGKEIPKVQDIYEQIDDIFRKGADEIPAPQSDQLEENKTTTTWAKEDNTQKFITAINKLDSSLKDYPKEKEALAHRIYLGLGMIDNQSSHREQLLEHLINIEKAYPDYQDIKMFKHLINAVLNKSQINSSIKSIETLISSFNPKSQYLIGEKDLFFNKDVYGYYLGYLYHLNNDVGRAKELKLAYHKSLIEEGLPPEIFSLY